MNWKTRFSSIALAMVICGVFLLISSDSHVSASPTPPPFIGGVAADPCQGNVKQYITINQTANTRLVPGVASKLIYPCHVFISPAAVATNIAFVEGTGSNCGTGTVAIPGLTGGDGTAAKGANITLNEGFVVGAGTGAVGQELTTGDDLCLVQSAANQISGGLSYVVQPQ